jgi:hypothetical protein
MGFNRQSTAPPSNSVGSGISQSSRILVTGKTLRGSKTTTLGGSNVRVIARILLRELAAEGKA